MMSDTQMNAWVAEAIDHAVICSAAFWGFGLVFGLLYLIVFAIPCLLFRFLGASDDE